MFNKALLPINGKPVVCQIVEKFPEEVQIVVATGYKGEQVVVFLSSNYPSRPFSFVPVDKYAGEGSGPGYSLLQCRSQLQCPFIYYSVDTIVTGSVLPPDHNWFGVAPVANTLRFCSCRADEHGRVSQIDDKNHNDNRLAFIGLAGVENHATFWQALENTGLIDGERQVSGGFEGLMRSAAGLQAREFQWFDTGTEAEYQATQAYFSQHPEQYR